MYGGKKCHECQPGLYVTESACPEAKVRARVHRDGHKNRPGDMPQKKA